jgi:hypothetical protein
MTGENGTPVTPDWTPDARPCDLAFWADHRRDMRDAEYRAAFLDASEHIVRGEN